MDGGVYANSPGLCALSRLFHVYPDIVNRRNSVVLSVGTGETRSQITSSSPVLRWGLFQWASRVVDILYDASEVSCHQTLQMILGDRYSSLLAGSFNDKHLPFR
eukprot:m.106874 g.106874  ORF g.106874 m.106874 type:complete len:104 (-) comp13311_c0_seq5:640-951(-)